MIRIKFEVEEQETEPLPIESENVGSPSDVKVVVPEKNGNNKKTKPTKFDQSMKQQQEIPIRIQQQQQSFVSTKIETIVPDNHQEAPSFLDQNFTTDSVAVGLNSIKTEPAESSLSLTTQLNNSLNIQSLLRQNRIQKGWTTNESTSSIGTKQQQQSFLLPKTEPIVPEIHQEVPLSLDLNSLIPNLDSEETSNYDTAELSSLDQSASIPIRTQQQQSLLVPKIEPIVSEIHQEVPLSLDLNSLIPNLDFEETSNYDTAEIQSLDQSASIPNGTQQQQSLLVPKIEPIVSEIHQEVPSSLEQSSSSLNLSETTINFDTTEVSLLDQSSSNPNPNSMETTATNCEITTTEMFSAGPRAGLSRRAKLNVCYSVPMEPNPVPRRMKKLPESTLPSSPSADNLDSVSNHNDQHSGFGLISGLDLSTFSTTAQVAAPSQPPEEVPLLSGKKPLRRVPFTLEEKKARKRENDRARYHRQRANPEVRAEKQHRKSEYNRKYRQQWLDRATPEQRELIRLKQWEYGRRHRENQTEEQRQRRLDRERQYKRTVGNQRRKQLLDCATPEQRELIRLKQLEYSRRHVENQTEEQRQRRLERMRQYKQRMKQKTLTPEERKKKRAIQREYKYRYRNRKKESLEESQIGQSQTSMSSSSMNLVVMDNSESSTSTFNQLNHSLSTITSDNNGIGDIGTTISKRKRKPNKKHFELSTDDSDLSHFDIDGGGGNGEEESNSHTTLESPKPGPSKLPRPTRCQRNLKSKLYLEPSTDSDDSD